ncbi:MAG: hypothetical protein OEZ06_05955 [Myxococcales bacterium]|nr:hypothetical protein [Myxococcales bacterium]
MSERGPRALRWMLPWLLLLPLGLIAGRARAAPRGGAGGGVGSVAALQAQLQGSDPQAVRAAIDGLVARADARAVAVLDAFLLQGQPDALSEHTLRALAAAKRPDRALPPARALLQRMARHRRAAVRQLALDGLLAMPRQGTEAEAAIEAALAFAVGDSDAGVRGRAARGLGLRGARAQLPLLFRALDRGVREAAPAIGRLADAAATAGFHERLGRSPIDVMLSGYEQLLLRADLDEPLKLDIVARLGEVAGPSVKIFLERMARTLDFRGTRDLRHAVVQTARRIDDRPGHQGKRIELSPGRKVPSGRTEP